MAPTTRSSAPSTPAKPRLNTTAGTATPPGASTRRTPHCTKCHRPRAGHPRSGCPYVGVSSNSGPTSPSATKPLVRTVQLAHETDDGISDDLSSLHIVSPTEESRRASMPRVGNKLRRRFSVRFALVPEQTLASLSSTDAHLVEQLLQPGTMSDVVSPQERVAHVLEWRKTLDGANSSDAKEEPVEANMAAPSDNAVPPLSRTMPCTLFTPTASLATTEPVTDQGIGGSALDINETVYLLPDPDVKKTKPLVRSMSFEQRSLFLQQLSHSSNTAPATLVSIPLSDLDNVQNEAENVGFHVRVLPNGEDDRKWVVLGTEEEAINLLVEKFLEEEKRSKKVKGQGGKLTAVAGGVVFGAVATWTSLAFS